MSEPMSDYYAALERLKQRRAKINNDAVALEAGRKKGSIKKSRPQFAQLIADIDQANREVAAALTEPTAKLERVKSEKKTLEQELDDALEREIALLKELFELKVELAQLRGGAVVPIRTMAAK
jgi:hypothetical protein